MISRIRSPFYIFFLNPVYVAARSLRSLRSNKTLHIAEAVKCGEKVRIRSVYTAHGKHTQTL